MVVFLCKPEPLAMISMLVSKTMPRSGYLYRVPHGAFADKLKFGGERAESKWTLELQWPLTQDVQTDDATCGTCCNGPETFNSMPVFFAGSGR